MRQLVSRIVQVRKGDLVVIASRLPRGVKQDARLSVWSALSGDEMSPHVQQSAMGVLMQGRPQMVVPMSWRLIPALKSRNVVSFIADENLTFCVMQDIDVKGDPLAKIRITGHGKLNQGIRRFLQDALGFLRRRSKDRIRHAR